MKSTVALSLITSFVLLLYCVMLLNMAYNVTSEGFQESVNVVSYVLLAFGVSAVTVASLEFKR